MNNSINCLIVDDDETSRFILSNLANKLENIDLVGACESVKKAKEIISNTKVDLLFLDIEMPEETGVEFIKNIENPIDVIFITSQTKHAIEAFEYDAVDYIVKPVDLNRLQVSVDKVFRRNSKVDFKEVEDFIILNKNRNSTKYLLNDILYIEARTSYVTYFTTTGEVTTTGVLKKIEPDLNTDFFIRVHRSYIVNIKKILSIEKQEIILAEQKLPLSRKYRKEVLEKFNTLKKIK